MQTLDEYEQRERLRTLAEISTLDREPLADRKSAQADYLDLYNDPERFRERMDWMRDGNYGQGAYVLVREIIARKRGNRGAQLAQLLAAMECRCPNDRARKAYTEASPEWREAMDARMRGILADYAKGGDE